MEINPTQLSDLSDLDIEFSVDAKHLILVVTVSGQYRTGSQGNPDARYINAMIAAGLKAYDPVGLVLDFSMLDYQWGNALLCIFETIEQLTPAIEEPDEPPSPLLIVAGASSRDGLLSLTGHREDHPPDWLFDSLNDALTAGFIQVQAWLDFI